MGAFSEGGVAWQVGVQLNTEDSRLVIWFRKVSFCQIGIDKIKKKNS